MARPRGAPHSGARRVADRHTQPSCRLAGRDLHTILHYMLFFPDLQAVPRTFAKKSGQFCNFQQKAAAQVAAGPCFRQFFRALQEVIPFQNFCPDLPRICRFGTLTPRPAHSIIEDAAAEAVPAPHVPRKYRGPLGPPNGGSLPCTVSKHSTRSLPSA